MIVTKVLGGLGNQMFQYAFGRANALRNGTQLFLDRRSFAEYQTHSFGLHHLYAEISDAPKDMLPKQGPSDRLTRLTRRFWPSSPKVYVEKSFLFDPVAISLRGDIYFDGYWQSEKYFAEFASSIRSELSIKTPPSSVNLRWLERIRNAPSVSIHVRRGDYVSNQAASQVHGTCDLTYYSAAMEFMRRESTEPPVFFVFSDDHEWVRQHMSFGENEHCFVTDNVADTNYEDLRLMSACRHHIIANSTFSWWGAWLNPSPEKVVIAPRRWFASAELRTDDLIPKDWRLL